MVAEAGQANHLGALLTRDTPRAAPSRDALVTLAANRARTPAPAVTHPLNDLQESILAAIRELGRLGHPLRTP